MLSPEKQPDFATPPLVSHEMTSNERLQKFHTDDVRVTIQRPGNFSGPKANFEIVTF